jgi:hypothetical protein
MFDAIPFQLLNRKMAERKTWPVNNTVVLNFQVQIDGSEILIRLPVCTVFARYFARFAPKD